MIAGNHIVLRLFVVALLLPLALADAQAQGLIEQADCLTVPAGHVARCGYVTLPQDYDDPGNRQVEIYYTVIQSRGSAPQPDPLVYLVGGPGSSGSQLLQTSFNKYLRAFASDRDIIVIDQRGTGLSNPPLYCREVLFRLDEILQSHHADYAELVLEILTDCHQRLSTKGVRFDSFHSVNIARDVVNVMLSLGYEQWNLVGVSYGSRLALTILRDHPEGVRAVILDSVYPPPADFYGEQAANGARALATLFAGCAADPSCAAAYPELDIRGRLRAKARSLAERTGLLERFRRS
jgi:pimeloyl-ACP methyl ester carboxylesterase